MKPINCMTDATPASPNIHLYIKSERLYISTGTWENKSWNFNMYGLSCFCFCFLFFWERVKN